VVAVKPFLIMNPLIESYFEFIKRLILACQGDSGVIGLDIGPLACRAVELCRKKGGFEVVRWITEPIEGVDEKSAINRLLEKLGPAARTRPVVLSLSGKGTLIRHVDIPRMANSDFRKAFPLEAEKYFPFPKETVYMDFFILDPKGQDKKMSVIVAAVKKDIVEGRLKLFKECGIEPVSVTIISVAVANAFAALPPATCSREDLGGKAVALIDIGETVTSLMIMVDGIPRFTRDIFMGMADVTRRVANTAGLSLPQARALCVMDAAAGHEVEIQKSVEAVLTNLVTEIRLSFDYFSTERKLSVGRICLIGDGVYVPHVESVFATHFDIPLVVWNPAAALHTSVDRDAFLKEGRRMVTAIGLAVGEYD
jgi:type IV pilus assembly protein PilM